MLILWEKEVLVRGPSRVAVFYPRVPEEGVRNQCCDLYITPLFAPFRNKYSWIASQFDMETTS